MLFKFKEKKVIVNAFLPEDCQYIKDHADIQPAHKFLPQWWKDLPVSTYDSDKMEINNTMRSCQGFLEHFKHGFIIPMWSDLNFKVTEGGWRYQYSDTNSKLDVHDSYQAGKMFENHLLVKIHSPWLFFSEQGIYFDYIPCYWNDPINTQFSQPPGTLDFYYQNSTHIFFVTSKEPKNIFIEYKRPMIHYVPLTTREVEVRSEVLSLSEYTKLQSKSYPLTFARGGTNRSRAMQGKCPLKTILTSKN